MKSISDENLPFVELPDLKNLINDKYHPEFSEYALKLNEDGFCVVDLDIDNLDIDNANADIEEIVSKNKFKTNSAAYHYNDSPRIVEGWKFSESIKKIALNTKLNDILNYCYQSDPIPFSTINFLKGTEQPLHSDEFHFGSIPHKYLTGVWIALEDIDPDAGPLSIARGSHKLPLFSFERIGLKIPKSETEFKESYTKYEEWAEEMINENKFEIVTPVLKKGQCLIWLSNVLHGSYEIKNHSLSRKSLVVHFHFSACKQIFFPSHSNLEKNRLVPRSLKDLDIRNQ